MNVSKIKFKIFGIALVGVILFSIYCNYSVEKIARDRVYDDAKTLPFCKVGLLLGTSKKLQNGYENLYFTYRIDAASRLIQSGKIEKILISGDNSRKDYDEPNDMRTALIEKGVDSNQIVLDYAGFRTFDSMIRLREIFGQTKAIVISQRFHNERAIYIGDRLGIDIYGYNAKDVSQYYGFKTNLREYFARVKTVLDFIIHVQPKFLGEKIPI